MVSQFCLCNERPAKAPDSFSVVKCELVRLCQPRLQPDWTSCSAFSWCCDHFQNVLIFSGSVCLERRHRERTINDKPALFNVD